MLKEISAETAAPEPQAQRRFPQRRRKKRLTGVGVVVGAMSPIRPNIIWAMDFQFDTTADGRTLKMLNVIDEFTREALAIQVDRGIAADGVVAVLDQLALQRGAPAYVRFDNGPECVAHAVNDWCRFNSAASLFIDPGSPWQNAWIESLTADCAMSYSTRGTSTRPIDDESRPIAAANVLATTVAARQVYPEGACCGEHQEVGPAPLRTVSGRVSRFLRVLRGDIF